MNSGYIQSGQFQLREDAQPGQVVAQVGHRLGLFAAIRADDQHGLVAELPPQVGQPVQGGAVGPVEVVQAQKQG
ncbi:MAG: hypothetical protein SNJ69_10905 [Chloroflexaceae bacterium]